MLHRTPMMHLRIAGTTWLVCGVLGTGVSLFDFARNLASGAFDGAIASGLIAAVFYVPAAFAGYGLTARGWRGFIPKGLLPSARGSELASYPGLNVGGSICPERAAARGAAC